MAIYVDAMVPQRSYPRARMMRCNLVADSLDELHSFATKLGIPRDAFCFPPRYKFAHYRITQAQQQLALSMGAKFASFDHVEGVASSCGFVANESS